MTDKFISIEGIARRYPGADGAATTIFENLWLSMGRGEFGIEARDIGPGRSGGSQVWQVDLTGVNERRIPTPLNGSDPAWGPLLP